MPLCILCLRRLWYYYMSVVLQNTVTVSVHVREMVDIIKKSIIKRLDDL